MIPVCQICGQYVWSDVGPTKLPFCFSSGSETCIMVRDRALLAGALRQCVSTPHDPAATRTGRMVLDKMFPPPPPPVIPGGCGEPGCTEQMSKGRDGTYRVHYKTPGDTRPCPKSKQKIT